MKQKKVSYQRVKTSLIVFYEQTINKSIWLDHHGNHKKDDDHKKDDHHAWSYNRQREWSDNFPICKGMKRQSPIDIITDDVVIKPEYELDFIDYDQEVEFQIRNIQHTISAMPVNTATIPALRLNWLDDCIFELNEIHFHWGDGINKGSEHKINGQAAAAEVSSRLLYNISS